MPSVMWVAGLLTLLRPDRRVRRDLSQATSSGSLLVPLGWLRAVASLLEMPAPAGVPLASPRAANAVAVKYGGS
jgi:hypothetical protein